MWILGVGAVYEFPKKVLSIESFHISLLSTSFGAIYSRDFLLYVFYVETVPVPKTAFANKLFPNSGVNHGVRLRWPLPSSIPGRRPN